jgi:signal transduction histidine kinase
MSSNDQRGTLGLINVLSPVELAAGELSICSAYDQGTEVRLTIELDGMS